MVRLDQGPRGACLSLGVRRRPQTSRGWSVMRFALLVLVAACANNDVEANSKAKKHAPPSERARTVAAINAPLCVTTGAAEIGKKVGAPAMRAIAKGTDGE